MSGLGGFQPSFHITHRMTAGLTRIERARGFLEAARLSENWLETMRSRAFVLEAHHTTHIEGTRLTRESSHFGRFLSRLGVRASRRNCGPEQDPGSLKGVLTS